MHGDDVLGVLTVLDRTQPPGTAAIDLAARFASVAAGVLELSRATRSMGSVLLRAAAVATDADRPDVAATLRALADADPGPDPEVAPAGSRRSAPPAGSARAPGTRPSGSSPNCTRSRPPAAPAGDGLRAPRLVRRVPARPARSRTRARAYCAGDAAVGHTATAPGVV